MRQRDRHAGFEAPGGQAAVAAGAGPRRGAGAHGGADDRPNPRVIRGLQAMGFDEHLAAEAALSTGNQSVEKAARWLVEALDQHELARKVGTQEQQLQEHQEADTEPQAEPGRHRPARKPHPPREQPPPLETEPEPEPEPDSHRDRASSMDSAGSVESTGSDFDEWMESALGRTMSPTEFLIDRGPVSLDVELGRTISTFHASARPEASSAVAALIDGEELSLSDDECDPESEHPHDTQSEPEAEPKPGLEACKDGSPGVGPRFDAVRLKAAVEARAKPVWERSTKNGGSSTCGWCDQTFGPTCWRYHCRRCGWAVCDGCSPHRMTLDTWLEDEKPHTVRHDVTEALQRVCDGCARAAHEPAAAPVFYLATISRVSDQTSVVRYLCISLRCDVYSAIPTHAESPGNTHCRHVIQRSARLGH
jgi:hypothetical protein